jgi:hypothetical protein
MIQEQISELETCSDLKAANIPRMIGLCNTLQKLSASVRKKTCISGKKYQKDFAPAFFGVTPRWSEPDRLPPAQLPKLRSGLIAAGLRPRAEDEADRKLCYNRN